MHFSGVGIPITMFSCHHKLLNAMMCITTDRFVSFARSFFVLVIWLCLYLALLNGLRVGILHCNVSHNKLILCVHKINEKDVVLNWPDFLPEGSHLGHCGYSKWADLLSDWGLELSCLNESSNRSREGFVTVSPLLISLITYIHYFI